MDNADKAAVAGKKSHPAEAGTVKWYDEKKGYGFIAQDGGGKDVFVHATALVSSNVAFLSEGDRVGFDVVPNRKSGKSQAENIVKMS